MKQDIPTSVKSCAAEWIAGVSITFQGHTVKTTCSVHVDSLRLVRWIYAKGISSTLVPKFRSLAKYSPWYNYDVTVSCDNQGNLNQVALPSFMESIVVVVVAMYGEH